MTDKQIIILKPEEDLNEKIIKEKGNTKCIFYADDICRNGDKTRDCINCARIEYHSLYSLNWDNQERLQKIIKQKEQECEELEGRLKYIINENKALKDCATDEHIDIVALKNYISTLEYHNNQLKAEVKSKTEYIQEEREIIDQYSKEIETYKKCQGKRASKREEELKAENTKYKQTLTEIKEIAENMNEECFYDDFDCMNCDMQNGCTYFNKKQILQKISEVIPNEN